MLAPAIRHGALIALLMGTAGCGGANPSQSCGVQGVVWLSWSVRGQPVSESACSGIDHLNLELHGSCGTELIEPIPCLRGVGWEYDGVPEGDTVLVLEAIDRRGLVSLQGSSQATITTVKPDMTTPIALQ
jgi:hypothetical protein